jgi:hypothetical protein
MVLINVRKFQLSEKNNNQTFSVHVPTGFCTTWLVQERALWGVVQFSLHYRKDTFQFQPKVQYYHFLKFKIRKRSHPCNKNFQRASWPVWKNVGKIIHLCAYTAMTRGQCGAWKAQEAT